MVIRNFPIFVFILCLLSISPGLFSQKKVNMDQAEKENSHLFSGSFFRAGAGISRANYNYHTRYSDVVGTPFNVNVELGKRMNRKFGAYFALSGNVMVKEIELGLNDVLQNWFHGGVHLGGVTYIMGGNSYFAAEAGMGVGSLKTSEMDNTGTFGVGSALKYGYDRHLAGSFFLGIQAFMSYAHTWDPDLLDAQSGKNLTANAFVYGVALNVKLGK